MTPIRGRLHLLKLEDAQRRGLTEIDGEWCAIVKIVYDYVAEIGSFEALPVGPVTFPLPDDNKPRENHVRDAVQANP